MKPKMTFKIAIDLLMTILLLLLMALNIVGLKLHEWIGAAMLIIFIIHNVLNYKWYINIFKGRYSKFRVFALVINICVLIAMILCMISGIMMSSYVFKFLSLKGNMALARKIHMSSSYLGLVLMSIHLGMHCHMIINMLNKKLSNSKLILSSKVIGIVTAVYGAYAFFKHDIILYIFLKKRFVTLNSNGSAILFFIDYIAVMGLWIFIAHYASKLLKRRGDN